MKLKLAENIRALRRARGLTQEQLAEALGVTIGAVSKWELGGSTPELTLIIEMASFLRRLWTFCSGTNGTGRPWRN